MTTNGMTANGMGNAKPPKGAPKCVDPGTQDALKHGEYIGVR